MSGRGGYDIRGYAERVERDLALIAGSNIPEQGYQVDGAIAN